MGLPKGCVISEPNKLQILFPGASFAGPGEIYFTREAFGLPGKILINIRSGNNLLLTPIESKVREISQFTFSGRVEREGYSGNGGFIVHDVNHYGRDLALMRNVRFYTTQINKNVNHVEKNTEIQFQEINIKRISYLKNLITAYETIKSKSGNMTPGADKETLDGMNVDYLKRISKSLSLPGPLDPGGINNNLSGPYRPREINLY